MSKIIQFDEFSIGFENYYCTNILREINLNNFSFKNWRNLRFYVKSILDILQPLKNAISTILAALYFEYLVIFDNFICEMFPKIKIESIKNCKNDSFWPSEIKVVGKLLNFHCLYSILEDGWGINSKFSKVTWIFLNSILVFCLIFHLIYQFRSLVNLTKSKRRL